MAKKIGLTAALLININIIIGAGVFLNVKPLTQIAGPLGFAGYLLGSAILFPFVFVLAKLAQMHPVSGGLYVYSKEYLSPFAGFVSGWSYFIGKTVSATFLALAFTKFFQSHIPCLQTYSTLLLSCFVIFSIIFLNILGTHIGGTAQYVFIIAKMIPILFVYIAGISLIKASNFSSAMQPLTSVIATVPVALYALMGFEITCSIGHLLKNGKANIPRTILGSFLFVTTIYILFQGVIFGALGGTMFSDAQPLTILANQIFVTYPLIGRLITALVFTAVIAGAFGILTSNCWNLYALAQDNHLPGSKFLTKLSHTHVPWISLVFQGGIACLLLLISENQIALQSMSVFGVVISFLLSALAALYAATKKQLAIGRRVCALALASCSYILFLCLQKMQVAGVSLPFLALLVGGVGIALFHK